MVVDVALYTVVHQPRRLKLPAQPIPRCASIEDITRCLFAERLNERYFRQVAQSCYYPAARMFLELVRRRDLHLALGISLSFVRQATVWEPGLLDLFRELVAEKHVEIIGVEPYRSLLCLIDLPAFATRMRWMADEIEQTFGKRPTVVDASEPGMSASIYNALDTAGFRGVLMESNPQVMQWRSSNYLYRLDDELTGTGEIKLPARPKRGNSKIAVRDYQGPPYGTETPGKSRPYLLVRHTGLSTDVSERFANCSWQGQPLYASTYASWIASTEGDFALLGWDFEVFGERHPHASGIFEFMQALPNELKQQGIAMRTPGELIDNFADRHAYNLSLPAHPPAWAPNLKLDSYFDQGLQQRALLQLMSDVYNLARLTENPDLLDLSLWLMQSDNFHFVQWPGPQIATSIVPYEWWRLGPSGILNEQRQVYTNALSAFAPYLPIRILRQTSHKSSKASGPAFAEEQKEAKKSEVEKTKEPVDAQKTGAGGLGSKETTEVKGAKATRTSKKVVKAGRRKGSSKVGSQELATRRR
jgi:alpha-amylase